jgi:hypothetical protein
MGVNIFGFVILVGLAANNAIRNVEFVVTSERRDGIDRGDAGGEPDKGYGRLQTL